jgi:PadR family transcriptional regulator PadR
MYDSYMPRETQQPGPRITRNVLEVLAILLTAGKPLHGMRIMELTHLPSGSVYPILDRLERAKWIEGNWEDTDPAAAKRPRRRNYTLTAVGSSCARQELRRAQSALSPQPGLAW